MKEDQKKKKGKKLTLFFLSNLVSFNGQISKFYFVINTRQGKLYEAWKITNLLNLNINLRKKKQQQTNKLVKS